jgi:alpha-tubulin suppressor-like RCC1 family protein
VNYRQLDKHPCENGSVRAGVAFLLLAAGCLEAPPSGTPEPPAGDAAPGGDAAPIAERAVSGSFRHFCAVVDGTAWCWGHNGAGQLGDGSKTHRSTAVEVLRSAGTPLTGVRQIAAGEKHTCALLDDTSVTCWGSNAGGQLGIGEADGLEYTFAETSVVNLSDVIEISAGGIHTCALRADQSVVCWGRGVEGQLGDGTQMDRPAVQLPVENAGETLVTRRVAAGRYHSCFVDDTSAVACTGWNEDGQAGQRTAAPPEPVCEYLDADRVRGDDGAPLGPASDVSSAFRHTCASVGLDVYCFGHSRCGALGDDDPTPCDEPDDNNTCDEATLRPYPVKVLLPPTCIPVRLAIGYSHSCTLCGDRTIQCWGSGSRGRLGQGDVEQHATPVEVMLIDSAIWIASGAESSCATLADNTIVCWGSTEFGQLGDGSPPMPGDTTVYQALPQPVVGLPAP